MARYYFDVRDSRGFHHDDVGEEFADIEEACEQCQGLLPDIAREEMPNGDLNIIICDVRDSLGRVVYRGELTFRGMRDPA